MYTGSFSPRGAGGRSFKGSGEHWERLAVHRTDWSAWVAWPRGLVSSGDRATRGPPQDWEVSLNFRRIRCMLGREHRATVDGARGRSVRAGCCPTIDYRALISFCCAIFGRSAAR